MRRKLEANSRKMKAPAIASLLVIALHLAISAQTSENHRRVFFLTSVTEGRIEAARTHRMVLCDYQPSGIFVRRGERLTLTVDGLDQEYDLASMIGFKPMWGGRNRTQEDKLRNGVNTVTAGQAGILSFIFVKKQGYDLDPATIRIRVAGGKAFPLFQVGRTAEEAWRKDLRTMTDSEFVQLVSDRVLITIPYRDFMRSRLRDVAASFETIHKVVDWEDELAGFDGSATENLRTNNRLHYAVDIYSTPKERESYYMYAADYLIGMQRGNFTELTEKLDVEWGIWHETGHTHQQNSWLWSSIGEISVNMFSLYVQEKFGLPSRLGEREDGETLTSFEKARRYLALPEKNYLDENENDYNELFSKLVMFHQLKSVYGWDAIKRLHRHFRKRPYAGSAGETDADKANKFIYAMCVVTSDDLIPFFKRWGLEADSVTAAKIRRLKLRTPAVDPSSVLK